MASLETLLERYHYFSMHVLPAITHCSVLVTETRQSVSAVYSSYEMQFILCFSFMFTATCPLLFH